MEEEEEEFVVSIDAVSAWYELLSHTGGELETEIELAESINDED